MNDKLNILIYITHDSGRHFGCYGNPTVSTPNVDRMAAEGVRFSNHFCTSPGCSPSRGSIFTGRYPHSIGLTGLANWKWGWRLNPDERHMAAILHDAGYESALFGAQHEIDPTNWPDFAAELGYERHATTVGGAIPLEPIFIEALRERAAHPSGRPFFYSVATGETHRPVFRPNYPYPHDDPDKVWVPPYLPDLPEVRSDIAAFHSLFKAADHFIGEILNALDETGLSEDTLFIYTTDHGIPYPRAKMSLYDPGLETALVMRGPQGFRGGKVFPQLLSNIDLLPTILEAAGVAVPERVQGRSFLPLVQGGAHAPRGEIFGEKTYHARYDPMRCVRTERLKYIRNWKLDEPLEMYDWLEAHPERTEFRDYFAASHPPEELYDLEKDRWEQTNRAGSAEYAGVLQDLRARVTRFMQDTDDPLLKGKPPYPRVGKTHPAQEYYEE